MSTTTIEKPTAEDTGPRAFAVLFQKIADGDAHTQASEDLQSLLKVMATRAREQVKTVKGSLTITLNIACDEKGTLVLGYTLKKNEPQPKRAPSVFWVDRNGNMTDKNPRQIELGLKDVSSKRGEVKDVGAVTAKEI